MSVPELVAVAAEFAGASASLVDSVAPARPRSVSSRIRLWTPDEILQRPDPEDLVRGMLVEGGFAAVYGRPATYKTFLALDVGFSVATGLPFAGREVRPGFVAYVAAEGSGGARRRIAAWRQYHGVPVTDFRFITQAINFADPRMVTELIERLQDLPESPVLLIIDTLARCFGGGDENSAQGMGAIVAAVDRVREAIRCAVLLVHHAPYQGGKLRGSSALLGALDTVIAVERDGDRLVLSCQKQKDGPEFGRVCLVASQVELEDGTSSLVLVPDGDERTTRLSEAAFQEARSDETERERRMLEELATFGPQGATATWWEEAAAEGAGVSRASFYRAIKRLVKDGKVEKFDVTGKSRYRVVEATPGSEIDELIVDDEDLDDFEW